MPTHRDRDKMADILQATVSISFSWMKSDVFWLKFNWSMFLMVKLTISQHDLDNGLVPSRQQAIIWINDGLVCWRIYALLRLDKLIVKK